MLIPAPGSSLVDRALFSWSSPIELLPGSVIRLADATTYLPIFSESVVLSFVAEPIPASSWIDDLYSGHCKHGTTAPVL